MYLNRAELQFEIDYIRVQRDACVQAARQFKARVKVTPRTTAKTLAFHRVAVQIWVRNARSHNHAILEARRSCYEAEDLAWEDLRA